MRTSSNLSNHVLPVSATMVGVCMTVISVVRLIPRNSVSHWADDLLAVDSLLFMLSALLSYHSIRFPDRGERSERRADFIFLAALSLMVLAAFIVSFELFKD